MDFLRDEKSKLVLGLKLGKFDSRSLTIRHFKDPCDITVDISRRFLAILAHVRIVENLPTFIVLSVGVQDRRQGGDGNRKYAEIKASRQTRKLRRFESIALD